LLPGCHLVVFVDGYYPPGVPRHLDHLLSLSVVLFESAAHRGEDLTARYRQAGLAAVVQMMVVWPASEGVGESRDYRDLGLPASTVLDETSFPLRRAHERLT
jgi:hypothetical protein